MDNYVLVSEKDQIVLTTENISYIGPLAVAIAGLLIDNEFQQSYITGINLYQYLARINNRWQNSIPGWKMRISGRQRIIRFNGKARGRLYVDYIAIDRKVDGKRNKRVRIDILNLDLLYDKPPTRPVEQLHAALAIIDLQQKRGIKKIRVTRGAIGSALLRNSPDWDNRHAAPRTANEMARKNLPGNFYSVSSRVITKNNGSFSLDHCFYVDQENAHHNIALSQTIPHPQSIHARGFYKDALENKSFYPNIWCHANSGLGQCLIMNHQPGLVLAKIHISHLPPTKVHLYPPWTEKRGEQYLWLWTPELRLLSKDSRFQLDCFIAGFTGSIRDTMLSEYAGWALDYLRDNPGEKCYTKTALLAAYGMLAFNTHNYNRIYRFWGGQVSGPKILLPEAGSVSDREVKLPDSRPQFRLTNVIARGLIEAETRTRSLEYAKELDEQGFHIAQIYVDGLLVETDEFSFVRKGWNINSSLTNVHIPRPNAFISDQLVKLPGIHRTEDDNRWMEKREESRKPLTARA